MKTKSLTIAAAAVFCAMTASAAVGQQNMTPQNSMRMHPAMMSRQGLSPMDKTFLKDTAQSNLGELKYAPLVEQKAQHPESKQFAQRMVQDHRRAQSQLKALAAQKGYRLPKETDEEEKQVMHRLSRERAANFDAAYKHEMIRDHTEDIAKTRREISLGRDPQVKAYAEQMLPILETHLNLAQALPAMSGHTGTMASQSK